MPMKRNRTEQAGEAKEPMEDGKPKQQKKGGRKEAHPGEEDGGRKDEKTLYDLLNVPKTAETKTIKKAYHKLALACHPDKHPDDPKAKENFQQLQRCKDVLLDETKRKVYDETGVIPGEDGMGDLSGKSFEELYEYYRALYQTVTADDVKEWEAKYPGSKEEKEDLKEFYMKYGGNMRDVCQFIPFCEEEDRYRIKEAVDKLIEDGELEVTEKYKKFKPKKYSEKQIQAMKQSRVPEEGWEEAMDEASAKKGKGGMGDLMAMIQAKQKERSSAFDDMAAALEANYCKPKKKAAKAQG